MNPRPESPLESEISDFAEIICGEDGMIPPVKHTRMMLLCTRAFIMEFLENCRTGQIHERAAVNILDEIREVLSSADAEKANSLWGFDYDSGDFALFIGGPFARRAGAQRSRSSRFYNRAYGSFVRSQGSSSSS